MQAGKFNILIGGMAGSESKGKISAYLTELHDPDLIVSHFMPNAGHTIITDRKYVSYHLPICAVVSNAPVVIGPGAAINPETFFTELETLGIDPSRLIISNRVPLITAEHIYIENQKLEHIASTTQGCGACVSSKIMRGDDVIRVGDDPRFADLNIVEDIGQIINDFLDKGLTVFCEMAQGFDLCLNHGIEYPYCTSRNIQPAQVMADSGVSPKRVGQIYSVIRPYPIRVGNHRGFSGPYAEAEELGWDEVKQRCGSPEDLTEITTTTKRQRRIFEFSHERFNSMITLVQPDEIALNFVNYINWEDYGKTDWNEISDKTKDWVADQKNTYGVFVSMLGTGPDHHQIVIRSK